MEHMEIWNKVKQPPPDALKKIQGGRLSGMTDINPQWRLRAMTDVFGPCGIGWKWAIEKLWTEPGSNGEVMAFAMVNVWTRDDENLRPSVPEAWSQPIPGIGGNALIAKERDGLRANDECFKMAVTDALSVAMKCLGVGADIYERKWDGSKYTMDDADKPAYEPPRRLSERTPEPLSLTGTDDPLLTKTEQHKLKAIFKEAGVTSQELAEYYAGIDVKNGYELRQSHLAALVKWAKERTAA